MNIPPHTRIAVVGGGVAGLAAARRLVRSGVQVSLFEAGPQAGGQIRTVDIAERAVDLGAEALHTAAPGALELLRDLGLEEEVVAARPAPTWLWCGRRLRPLPAGVGPAGPSRLAPMATSGVLSPRGVLRAACEPLVPRRDPGDDEAVGSFLRRRFGREVTDRLVDPLLGGLHAGDVGRLSLRTATPGLDALARRRRSLLLAGRRSRRDGSPAAALVTVRGGLRRLVGALTAGVEVHLDRRVLAVVPDTGRYRIEGPDGVLACADAVVVAVPAAAGAGLLAPLAREAADLAHVRAAGVVTAVLAYPRAAVTAAPALGGTGMLVRSSAGRLLKAATFLTTKWPHLDHPDRFLVRLSAGRADDPRAASLDDETLLDSLRAELAEATGLDASPVEVRLQRWPATMPQLEVGHRDRIAAVRHALAAHPGVELAGAPYDGVGVTSAARSGEQAAERTLHALTAAHR